MGKSLPRTISEDMFWHISVYRFTLFFGELGWKYVTRLCREQRSLHMVG